jgi:polyisoprenoid-binding protein YceI
MKILAVLAVFTAASFSYGSTRTFKIDPAHSTVGFSVKHLMVTNVKGTFNEFDGTILLDEKDAKKSKVETVIKASSIDTNNDKRDDHLRSADFFNAEKNPEIKFVSKKITPAGAKKYKVTGDLTMNGVTKEVVLDATFAGTRKGMQGETRAGFAATGKVKRSDFGIKWNKAIEAGGVAVGDDVTLNFEIEAVEETKTDTASKG